MLIKCPECQKEISDKAFSCPAYGYPINSENIVESNIENTLVCPVLPTDLSIGNGIVNWGGIFLLKEFMKIVGTLMIRYLMGK